MSNRRPPTSRELGSEKRIKATPLLMPVQVGTQQSSAWAMSPDSGNVMQVETFKGAQSWPRPTGLPTPHTSPDSSVDGNSYFMGSDVIDRYFIDLDDTEPKDFDPDIQAYLECVANYRNKEPFGSAAYMDEFEDEDDYGIPQHPKQYVPNIPLVAQGLNYLRQAREEGRGLWFKVEDTTVDDLQQFPHYPWLGSMIRRLGKEEALRTAQSFSAKDRHALILGNIRIALPSDLAGPKRNTNWAPLIGEAYGHHHPATVWGHNPWFGDEHIDLWIQWSVSGYGGAERMMPHLPDDPSLPPPSPIHIGYWRRNDGVEDRVW